jgi:hypothetical protein
LEWVIRPDAQNPFYGNDKFGNMTTFGGVKDNTHSSIFGTVAVKSNEKYYIPHQIVNKNDKYVTPAKKTV